MEKNQKQSNNDADINEDINEQKEPEPQLITEEDDTELINGLTAKIEVMQDKLLRTMAESENTRQRFNKMVEEAREYSIVNFAKDLIPVIDNLSRALAHVPKKLDDESRMIVEGVKMTKHELESVFKKHGLESIEPKEGENFDYNYHHAISQTVTDEYAEGTIVNIMQIGYKLGGRLIRPASVIVAKKN